MKLKLLKPVERLGRAGDMIETSDAYARNFLIPKKIAMAVTPMLLVMQQQATARRQKKDVKNAHDMDTLIKKIDGATIELTLAASPQGTLFAALKSADIQHELERRFKVKLPKFQSQPDHLKNLGSHVVTITVDQDRAATVTITLLHG